MAEPAVEQHVASQVEFVGYHDLEGKPAFKLAMQVVDDRWYLYLSHFWQRLFTIYEVTDPSAPRKVAEIPGPPNTWTLQVQVADGKLITGLERIGPGWGGEPDEPFDEGIQVWDVERPASPRLLSHWRTGGSGTHRNHYDGGRYVHLSAGLPGFAGNIYLILDIADPERPREAGRWFLPEQYAAGGGRSTRRLHLHGPAYPEGDRAYLGYGGGGMIILDISDVSSPRLVSRLDFGDAFANSLGMHTVIPLPRRKLAVVNTEAIAENAEEPLFLAGIVDIADEARPRLISLFPTPEPPPGAPYANFSRRGGRFGPHNQHHWQHQPHLFESDDLVYLTWFNAGLRVYDIRDPYLPREVGSFLPADPLERRGLLPKTLVTQTEDVLVDARGYAYLTDKNHGLFVVRYTGAGSA
jgi:hypothetical protein